jgi:hypothetical protein
MKNLKLITAILLEIRAFLNRNASFSAHDITTAIRKRVNAGEICVTDVDTLNSGAARIDHPQVRALIDEFYNEGLLPLYRLDTGSYRVYSATNNFPSPVKQTVAAIDNNDEPVNDTNDCDVEALVVGYVTRKLAKGQLPTLKGVQSRLKGVPINVVDIKNICCAKGFKVSPQAGLKPSLSIIYK